MYAYQKGQDSYGNPYYSGPLRKYDVYPSLLFSSDLHSNELQVADLIVGLIRDFLKWVKYGQKEFIVKTFFPIIMNSFRKDNSGRILNKGLIVSNWPTHFPNIVEKYKLVQDNIKNGIW